MSVAPHIARPLQRRRLLAAAVVLVLCASLPVALAGNRPSSAQELEDFEPAPNPDLSAQCGIDIHVVLDESTSIQQAGAIDDVRNAFRAFYNALRNTGSRLAVSEFGSQARLPLSGAAQRAYTTVTDATIANTFEPYISTGFNPPPIGANTQYTNWEDALRMGRHFLPRPSADIPHLTLFITDGDPTALINRNVVTDAQYGTVVPLSNAQVLVGQANATALRPAIPNANAIKAQGSHILAVGVGAALSSTASLNRLIQVSGPDVFPGTGPFDISTTDVYRQANFALLQESLRNAAFQLCSPSVNIEKLVDLDPDPAVDALQPGSDWEMTAEVTPEPDAWVVPEDGSGTTATNTTGSDGFVNFQWEGASESSIEVTETPQGDFVNDPAATTCTFTTPDQPEPQTLPDFVASPGGFTGTVPPDAIVTCQMVNRLPPDPAISIVKATNGADGLFIPVGEPITWTYLVTNAGNVPLTDVTVTDSEGVTVTCPSTTLAVEAEMTCTAQGVSVAGPYQNTGTATGTGAGEEVTDDDPSSYTGSVPGIGIEKATNGVDSDDAPGEFIPVGDPVEWTYVVTNTGDAVLNDIVVEDDQGVAVTCPAATLAPQEDMTCTAPATTAVAGQYENVATATGTSATDPTAPVQDSDPSHYFGEQLGITIVKTVNDDDANDPPGVAVNVGETVVWRFEVTNDSNVDLVFTITDPSVPGIECPTDVLGPGESTTCVAEAPAVAGQQTNTATVEGEAPSGNTVTDDDPANYLGVSGAIQIQKLIDEDDANDPPGVFLPVGSPVTWTYRVTNIGDGPLSAVTVTDTKGVTVTCPATELAEGASMDCTAAGTTEAGQYTNFGEVTAETPTGVEVRDDDPANLFGDEPGIHVEKLTNGVADADDPPGPWIDVGSEVTWTFIVTNTGNSDLTDVTVTDDILGVVECPQTTLAVEEEMTCTVTGTAEIGQYANNVTAEGTSGTGPVEDDDPSHHFGVVREIGVRKFVNGEDANEPPGIQIPEGTPVVMTFEVTNLGNVPLHNVVLTDDRGLTPVFTGGDTNGDGLLDSGEVWTFEAELGPATPGRFDNTVTVSADDGLETGVTADDPAFAGTVETPGPIEPPPPEPGPAVPGPDVDEGPDDARDGRLAFTGLDALLLVLLALALIAIGGGIRAAVRAHRARRQPAHIVPETGV